MRPTFQQDGALSDEVRSRQRNFDRLLPKAAAAAAAARRRRRRVASLAMPDEALLKAHLEPVQHQAVSSWSPIHPIPQHGILLQEFFHHISLEALQFRFRTIKVKSISQQGHGSLTEGQGKQLGRHWNVVPLDLQLDRIRIVDWLHRGRVLTPAGLGTGCRDAWLAGL
jgi:hypothetical protein